MIPKVDYKIVSLSSLKSDVENWKSEGKKIVFTNGCFDILHYGHIHFLSMAKEEGDILIVGLNTDDSVTKLKGESRPINNEKSRSFLMASLDFVDRVCLFGEDTPQILIDEIVPDILVKGGDYKTEEIVGFNTVTKNGGKVIALDYVEGYSTSSLEDKIRSMQKK